MVEVDGRSVRTDIIDIRNPTEHLAPLSAGELEAAIEQIGGTPVGWDDYLVLNPSDVGLIAMIHRLLGVDTDLAMRIVELRSQGKSPQEIFADPELRGVIMVGLALGMADAAGGRYLKGAGRKLGEGCKTLFRWFKMDKVMDELFDRFKKRFVKDAIKESVNLRWLRGQTEKLDLTRQGLSNDSDVLFEDLAKKLKKIAEQAGKPVNLDEARKIADEQWIRRLIAEGRLRPTGAFPDGWGLELARAVDERCTREGLHFKKGQLWREMAAEKLGGVHGHWDNVPNSLKRLLNDFETLYRLGKLK